MSPLVRTVRATALSVALLLGAVTSAETIAITGGKVATVANPEPIDGATVVIRDGKIVEVGRGVAVPAGARVIDATGKWVTPGLIAGVSFLGLYEVDAVEQTNDEAAHKAPWSAAIDIVPGLNPSATPVSVARLGGVTRAAVLPDTANSIFGGQGALIDLAANGPLLLRPRAFQFIELGEDGARNAGGSRPAAWLELRNAFQEAQRYARNPAAYSDGRDKEALVLRQDAAALVGVVDGTIPALIHVERASDIVNVIALPKEFPKMRIILVGAREGWMVADKIAAAKIPVITMALMDLPDAFETLGSTRSNVGRLTAAGVLVGLGMTTDGTGNQPRNLPQQAGNAVAQAALPGGVGLTHAQALAAITRNTAQIFGMADTGTLQVGKRGDVVVWDGDPLELSSAPTAVLIGGVVQPTVSRQTMLRDRYLNLQHDQLPLAYPR
jgi:imidazolonepropionase-like amidohydrolase